MLLIKFLSMNLQKPINYSEHNTWEEVTHVSVTCKQLMDEFEQNLAKQKELKAQQVAKSVNRANQMNMAQKIVKVDNSKAGPSSAVQAGYDISIKKKKSTEVISYANQCIF